MTDVPGEQYPESSLRDYDRIIDSIFQELITSSSTSSVLPFTLDEVTEAARRLGIVLRNPGKVFDLS